MSLKHIMNADWTSEEWYRMCGRKVRFTHQKAKKAAKRTGLRPYHCPHCDGFHLTSQQ